MPSKHILINMSYRLPVYISEQDSATIDNINWVKARMNALGLEASFSAAVRYALANFKELYEKESVKSE